MHSEPVSSRIDWRKIGLLVGLAVASILIRWPFLQVPMISDEGGYAYVARFWTDDYVLYRDIPFDRPQAIFLLYKFIFATFGTDIFAIRLFTAVYNAATVVALYALTRSVFGETAAWIAAGIFAVVSASPGTEGFTANAEIFMLLPIVLSTHLAWKQRWGWAGFLAAVAVLLKPSGGTALLLALVWVVIVRAPWRSAALVLGGFVLGILPSVIHGLWIGFDAFWRSIYERRLALYGQGAAAWPAQLDRLETGIDETLTTWAAPAILSVQALIQRWDRRLLFGALWVGTSLVGIAMGGWWRSHYFLQILPPFAFLSGAAVVQLRTNSLRWLWILAITVGGASFATDQLPYWFYSPREISAERFKRSGYLMADTVADYVSKNTAPDDEIYVAFFEAEFYYLSDRRAAIPQFYYDHIHYSREIFDQVIAGVRERRAELILVVGRPPAQFMNASEFHEILQEGYTRETTLKSVQVFRRKADRAEGTTPGGSPSPTTSTDAPLGALPAASSPPE